MATAADSTHPAEMHSYFDHVSDNDHNDHVWNLQNLLTIATFLVECCDMGQNDTIGKIELNPSFVLSSKSANSRNDIQ